MASSNFSKQEGVALAFAREHHSELAELIANLKVESPPEYEQAVRELFRVRERLSQFQKRNPRQYDLELELWKTKSRMRLMAARLSIGKDPALEQQFRDEFRRRGEIQMELLELERQQLEARLAEVNAALERGRQRPNARVDGAVQKALEKIRNAEAARRVGGAGDAPGQGTRTPVARERVQSDAGPK